MESADNEKNATTKYIILSLLSNQYFINNAIVITTNVIIQQVYVTYNAKTRFTINIKILKNKLNQFNDNYSLLVNL